MSEKILFCDKCKKDIYVDTSWYGTAMRFIFKCSCDELDILSGASYIETFDEARHRKKHWKYKMRKEKSKDKSNVKANLPTRI